MNPTVKMSVKIVRKPQNKSWDPAADNKSAEQLRLEQLYRDRQKLMATPFKLKFDNNTKFQKINS